ncbi:hypothetical protein [Bernardetia sp.]|uniref:hypothetical protein n=1 Tax=Bernardetia sp. TaxID=1937974 RepID=UPI0025BC677A|nr:hypothetical protein [Bernardetia sp.]
MKFFCLFLSLILYSFTVLGQVSNESVKINYSKEAETTNYEAFTNIIRSEDGYYAYKIKEKGIKGVISNLSRYIEKYDKDMNFIGSIAIEFTQEGQEYVSIEHINNKLYVFSSITNKKENQHSLFIQEVDKASLKLDSKLVKLTSVSSDELINEDSPFRISISPDNSKLAISYSTNKKKDVYKITSQVYTTSSLDVIWEKEIELNYTNYLYKHQTILVDDFGNTHILGEKINPEKKIRKEPKSNYIITSIFNNGSIHKTYEIPKEKYFTDLNIMLNTNQDIICTALYANDYKALIVVKNREVLTNRMHFPTDGVYFLRLDSKTGTKQGESFEEFDLEFISKNESEWTANRLSKQIAKGKDISLENYYIRKVIAKEDGGVFITAQYQSNNYGETMSSSKDKKIILNSDGSKTTLPRFSPSEAPVQTCKDIIVINLSAEGKTIWNEKIPLSQTTNGGSVYPSGHFQYDKNNSGFLTPDMYSVIYHNEMLYLVFNDNAKNTLIKDKDKLYEYETGANRNGYGIDKEHAITLLSINKQGVYERDILLTQNKKESTHIYPKIYFQTLENELILFARGKKMYRLVRLKF